MTTKIFLFCIALLYSNFCFSQLQNCETCKTTKINASDISNLSPDDLQLLINEMYARNGKQFEHNTTQAYFEKKTWYQPKPDKQTIVLTALEEENVKILKERINIINAQRQEIISQIKAFKKLVLADKKLELKSKFNFEYEKDFAEQHATYLKKILQKVDLDDLHFHKHQGLANVSVDNGIYVTEYGVLVESNLVNLIYSLSRHSKIFDESDFPIPFPSEEEFTLNWQLEFIDGKLSFKTLLIAG